MDAEGDEALSRIETSLQDSLGPRVNLNAFRTHFPDVIHLAEELDIQLPTIVVVGDRGG